MESPNSPRQNSTLELQGVRCNVTIKSKEPSEELFVGTLPDVTEAWNSYKTTGSCSLGANTKANDNTHIKAAFSFENLSAYVVRPMYTMRLRTSLTDTRMQYRRNKYSAKARILLFRPV
jgi:hypothetical protein